MGMVSRGSQPYRGMLSFQDPSNCIRTSIRFELACLCLPAGRKQQWMLPAHPHLQHTKTHLAKTSNLRYVLNRLHCLTSTQQ